MASNNLAQEITKFFADKDVAKNYAAAERATGPAAQALIRQAGLVPDDKNTNFEVLDNACGTGIVTSELYETFKGKEDHLRLVCGDFSAQMVESVKERIKKMEGLNAEAKELNGQAMDVPSNHFTHVLTNFGFQSFSEPLLGLSESVRVTKPGGTIGMTNFVKVGWLPFLRRALSRIPGAPSLPDPLPLLARPGKWYEQAWTRQQLEAIAEVDPTTIQIEDYSFTTVFKDEKDIRDFVAAMKGMISILVSQWSEAEQKACEGKLVEAVVRAMIEEPTITWELLITTAHKRT